jgi:5-hydroxyisourate hydrolase
MSAVTTHVLDAALGRPAAGLPVRLEQLEHVEGSGRLEQQGPDGGPADLVGAASTDADGRISDLCADQIPRGTYRLVFDTGAYFSRTGRATFYPQVVVVFRLDDPGQHYHVPLLLSPFAYSTYRGS